jgi:hypothetical protein
MGFDTDPNKLTDKDRAAIVDAVEELIENWDEKLPLLYPVNSLNTLLKEHWELCDQIWQIRDRGDDDGA